MQSKYGRAFQGDDTLLREANKLLETLGGQRPHLSSVVDSLLHRLRTFLSQASERDRLVLVFATEEPLSEGQKRTLDRIRAMGRGQLGAIFDVESVSIETIYQRTLEEAGGPGISVDVWANVVPCGEDLLVGSIPLLNLYEFLKAYRKETEDLDRLYEKNVRRFLGSRGRVNKAMQATLRDTPELFGLYNNGITIVVAGFEYERDGAITLHDPYVVNGCQTTRTIWEVCHQRLEAGGTGHNPDLDAWRERAKRGLVVTKIARVGATGEEALHRITRYTNSQNAVREKDFLALTGSFRDWAAQMAQRGIFLEIQRGGWDSRKALQAQNPALKPQFKEYANAFDLIKVYGAGWLGEPGLAFGKNAPFLPNGAAYEDIMNSPDGGAAFGVEDLMAAYALQQRADSYEFGRGAEKQSRKQTRFLFYRIVIELLRDVAIRKRADATPTRKDMTRALLGALGNEAAADALLSSAIDVVDDYLTRGTDETVFLEPVFQQRFNNDLNAFLKWEQLGKNLQDTPHLSNLLAVHKVAFGKGNPSRRQLVMDAIPAR